MDTLVGKCASISQTQFDHFASSWVSVFIGVYLWREIFRSQGFMGICVHLCASVA